MSHHFKTSSVDDVVPTDHHCQYFKAIFSDFFISKQLAGFWNRCSYGRTCAEAQYIVPNEETDLDEAIELTV